MWNLKGSRGQIAVLLADARSKCYVLGLIIVWIAVCEPKKNHKKEICI
ncbi:hypothetical protein [Neobacillus sp. 19]